MRWLACLHNLSCDVRDVRYPDDDVLNEDWIKYRMVRSHRLLSLVLVAIGVGRRIQKRK
jgi:hypothetical protein